MRCNPRLSQKIRAANKSFCRTYLSRWWHCEYQAFAFRKEPLHKVQTQPQPEIQPLDSVNWRGHRPIRNSHTCFVPKNMTIICLTKQGELFFVLEGDVGPGWDVLLVQSVGTIASGSLNAEHGAMSSLLLQLAWIENFPHSRFLSNPGLGTLPKDLLRKIWWKSANDCLQPLVRLR